MKHRHCLSESLAKLLISISGQIEPGQKFHLQNDLHLTKNQYNNFQKLRYWGLTAKCFELGKRKGGYWILTPLVRSVLAGGSLPKNVTTFNNAVVEISAETTSLFQAVGYYDTPAKWANRAEQMEGIGQGRLL
jgi:hypothetical protein